LELSFNERAKGNRRCAFLIGISLNEGSKATRRCAFLIGINLLLVLLPAACCSPPGAAPLLRFLRA